jgi:hypothetical protein
VAEQRDEEPTFPEPPEGLVKPEDDSVVAFLDEPDQVEAAMEQLVAEGFDSERIYVLCGTEGARRLDVSGKHHGLKGRVYRLVEWMSDEKGILFRARDHLESGGLVISVPAGEEAKAEAARILGAHGGHGMAHFGRDHWKPIGV